ncbi:hypothetical protein G6O69_26165 [Pseudenhygromyxa sp. WMMC2535]|uniref:metallophosphoesterase n=1 Tax=Pseudenhygromyxa sp. WMMC2535 TaxID=2712867 RepID=UPI0015540ABE|nr:hypothetical protein [Pseudenhygromyxa sp. WMMC2535]
MYEAQLPDTGDNAEDEDEDSTEESTETDSGTGSDTTDSTESTEETDSGSETDTSAETGDDGRFRVVIFADSHVVGPEYQGGDSNLLNAEQQLEILRWEVEHIDPLPDFAVILGGLVHDAYPTTELDFYENNPNAFAIVDEILDGFPIPVYQLFGDSDYGVPDVSRSFSHTLFYSFFQKDPYYVIDHGGWRFFFTNSQLGHSFDAQTVGYDPSLGSYGANQLNWLSYELEQGGPAVVFSHFPIHTTAIDEELEGGGFPDMRSLLLAQDNVELIFAGHTYTWVSTPGEFGAPHYEVGATRYDTDNFLLLEFDDQGGYEFLDIEKVQWNTPNADHWDYSEDPPVPAG